MNIINKIRIKLQIEMRFYLEQQLGWIKPDYKATIPKYLLKKYVPPNPVIIDCGAHTGADSIELARKFSNSIIHSFEPVPKLYSQLKHNIRRYSNIKTYEMALSDNTGKALFNISGGESDQSSSLLKPKDHLLDHPNITFDEILEVDTMTLDDWSERFNIEKIDFLWLDMQGFELQMLKKAPNVLSKVKVIYTEISSKETYVGVSSYFDFKTWLESEGFLLRIEAMPEGYDMGNAVFVKAN
jgi:FkbM family methyltransferase